MGVFLVRQPLLQLLSIPLLLGELLGGLPLPDGVTVGQALPDLVKGHQVSLVSSFLQAEIKTHFNHQSNSHPSVPTQRDDNSYLEGALRTKKLPIAHNFPISATIFQNVIVYVLKNCGQYWKIVGMGNIFFT